MTMLGLDAHQNALLDELRAIVGAHNVLVGQDAEPAMVDPRAMYRGEALAVVRPGNTDEVCSVVKWCVANDVVIVAQGGNTSLSGGATPVPDDSDGSSRPSCSAEGPRRQAIVVSTQRLNQIEDVDASGFTMTVGAGVTIEAMHDAARAVNRQFAPDWGARGSATIGGGIATDAGGNNVVRYGNMRDQVLGLEVVLADGRVWDGLRSLRKDSSGYDIKQLFVGSEGTLGIITRALVRLVPATAFAQTALASLRDLDALMDLFSLTSDVTAETLVSFELMPGLGVRRVSEVAGVTNPLPDQPGAEPTKFYVLIKLASSAPVEDLLAGLLARAAELELIGDAVIAATAEQERQLWRIREEHKMSNLFALYAEAIKMDTAVPIQLMPRFYEAVENLASELTPDALVFGFGHVGDGNIHLYVLPTEDDQVAAFRGARDELTRRIDEMTFSLGGTLSAEHGVGRALRDRVGGQKPGVEWDMMRSIKAAFDPHNRLNPGALFG